MYIENVKSTLTNRHDLEFQILDFLHIQLICPKGEVFISGILITHCEVPIKVYRRIMTTVESEIITLHWTT